MCLCVRSDYVFILRFEEESRTHSLLNAINNAFAHTKRATKPIKRITMHGYWSETNVFIFYFDFTLVFLVDIPSTEHWIRHCTVLMWKPVENETRFTRYITTERQKTKRTGVMSGNKYINEFLQMNECGNCSLGSTSIEFNTMVRLGYSLNGAHIHTYSM